MPQDLTTIQINKSTDVNLKSRQRLLHMDDYSGPELKRSCTQLRISTVVKSSTVFKIRTPTSESICEPLR